jgi:hypothetical protein
VFGGAVLAVAREPGKVDGEEAGELRANRGQEWAQQRGLGQRLARYRPQLRENGTLGTWASKRHGFRQSLTGIEPGILQG